MAKQPPTPIRSSAHSALSDLVCGIDAAWGKGWAPDELVRAADKLFDSTNAAVMATAIILHRRSHPAPAGEDWLERLDHVGRVAPTEHPERLCDALGVDDRTLTQVAGNLASWLKVLPRMAFVCAPPGTIAAGAARRPKAIDKAKLLERVRALLAKAEATQFPHEAQAFTAKAQQIMTSHSIELAMLDDPAGEAPAALRIWHDPPYASAKGDLLASIAAANGCRTVSHGGLDVSTVFGFRHDLDSVELLHTSLLVQATAEMTQLETQWQHDRRRIRSFRHSFLIGFASRIGQRLEQARRLATEQAGVSSDALHPVLVSRSLAVDRAVDEVYPKLSSKRRSLSNSAGYVAGTIAADRASIGPSTRVGRGRAG
ncbi:MAG: DUF2786 domain-containing protein [Acidimicrobiales bacterium]|nr:DUF2786 domain-containing protein [Acidimicrobiales bacterium]